MRGETAKGLLKDLLGDAREWARDLFVATIVGVFLGLVGPYGSYLNGPPNIRIAYWVAALWIGALVFGLTLKPLLRILDEGLLRWLAFVVTTLPAMALIGFFCRLIAQALWPTPIGRIGALDWYAQTLIIATPITVGYALLAWRRRAELAADPLPSAGAERSFLARLPFHLGRELIALQMEDHYVRAHTAKGSTLVLVPLNQAIRELEEVEGLKVHRSWWVARRAVTSAVLDGRNLRLKLANGIEAPVARSRVAAVRAAGLLAEPLEEAERA